VTGAIRDTTDRTDAAAPDESISTQIAHHRDTEAQRILGIQDLATKWLLKQQVSGCFVATL
jgi:hypothetical protein